MRSDARKTKGGALDAHRLFHYNFFIMSICHTHALSVAVLAAFALAPFACARGADEPASSEDVAAKEELAYIDALVNANMPDLAEPVIEAAKKRWPALGPKFKVRELQGALRLGKFDEVKKVIAEKKTKDAEYWALSLSLADANYARGMMAECRKIYQDFFKSVPKPGADLLDFYVESGFKWAQMCVAERNFDEAVKMYGELLTKNLPEERWCTVAMEEAGLLIQLAEDIVVADPKKDKAKLDKRNGYIEQATKLVDKLLWKNELIIVFGKAIAMKAHIEMLRGNVEKAQSLVTDYMPQLAEIHNSLRSQDPDGSKGYVRMSPMPECRYLLAKMLWAAAQAESKAAKPDEEKIKAALLGARVNGKRNGLGAFNHAVNVFIQYPESSSSMDAGQVYEEIAAFVLERYKADLKKAVKITPEQLKKVIQKQFDSAYAAYKGGDLKTAAKAYTALLAQHPDAEQAPGAMAVLINCNLDQLQSEKDAAKKKELRAAVDADEDKLATAFAGKGDSREKAAGDEILRLAVTEREAGFLARSQQLYDLYFKNFSQHYNAAQTALNLAGQAFKAEDWEKAIRFHTLVATVYTNSPYYASSLNYLATCCGKMDDEEGQKTWLRKFVEASKKVNEKSAAQFQLAIMQQRAGFANLAAAAETNVVEAAEQLRKSGAADVKGAIADFHAVGETLTKELDANKSLEAAEKEKFLTRREQAMFLEADSWQRLAWPEDEIPENRKKAVAAFEEYLKAYPKGKYGPVALVKIGTIHTADKNMDASQKAFARLQESFPESDEAKNSVPRLAKTLIEMGLRQEGVAQYKQMLETKGGKYTSGQFLLAGDALLEAKGWDVATEAYTRAIDLSKDVTNKAARAAIVARAALGQASASVGQQQYADAHQKLDEFIEKNAKSQLVIDAYEMLVKVASEEGRREKDDLQRTKNFNAAVGAIKKLRAHRKTQAELDILDLRSADVMVSRMEAEEAMNLKDKAEETCRLAVAAFQAYLMSHEPTEEHPAKDMTPAQLANLERCYGTVLPLMARLGKDQSELILKYGAIYQELFPNGKRKTAVQNALNQAKADQ